MTLNGEDIIVHGPGKIKCTQGGYITPQFNLWEGNKLSIISYLPFYCDVRVTRLR